MEWRQLECVSIAVPSLDSALAVYEGRLGLQVRTERRKSKRFPLRWVEVGTKSASLLELLEPTDGRGPIQQFLDRRGPGVYQVRLGVENLESAVTELEEKGVQVIRGKDVSEELSLAWIHPHSSLGVLFELMEGKLE